MREIKFRVWDKNIPRTIEEKELKTPSGEMVEWDYIKESSYWFGGLNGEYPMMQYTGLKDKNDKEVYEGDILKEDNLIGEVKWVQEHCAFMIRTIEPHKYHYITSDGTLKRTEVIGNIYENSDLLKC